MSGPLPWAPGTSGWPFASSPAPFPAQPASSHDAAIAHAAASNPLALACRMIVCALVIERALTDPSFHQIDRGLIETGRGRWAAERHACARDSGSTFDFLQQIAVGRIAGLDPLECRLFEACHADDVREGVPSAQILHARQSRAHPRMATRADRRE